MMQDEAETGQGGLVELMMQDEAKTGQEGLAMHAWWDVSRAGHVAGHIGWGMHDAIMWQDCHGVTRLPNKKMPWVPGEYVARHDARTRMPDERMHGKGHQGVVAR